MVWWVGGGTTGLINFLLRHFLLDVLRFSPRNRRTSNIEQGISKGEVVAPQKVGMEKKKPAAALATPGL